MLGLDAATTVVVAIEMHRGHLDSSVATLLLLATDTARSASWT